MKRYDSYKDSGVQWIGEVPSHWEVSRIKFYGNIKSGDGINSNSIMDEGPYEVWGGNGLIGFCENYNVNENNIIIGRVGALCGNVRVTNSKKFITDNALVFIPNNNASTSFLTLFLVYADLNKLNTSSAQPLITGTKVMNLSFVVPPIEEQTAIANYLDNKCAKIDNVIATQEKRVELLRELKQSIITRAVTRGINPDAKMKDSGVDSIGIIPTTWEVCKTLYVLSQPITDGPHETPQLFDEGIPFVSAEAVSCGNGKIDFDHIRGYISESYYKECCKKYIPQKGDVYMIKSGATTGKVSIVDTDRIFTIWSPLAAFRCNKDKMLPYFLFFALQCPFYQRQVELGWNYGTQQNIGMRTLEKLFLPVPPIEEQAVIIKYIEQQTSCLDSSITKALRQIELLKEYKQSLITEVVTGKRKVC